MSKKAVQAEEEPYTFRDHFRERANENRASLEAWEGKPHSQWLYWLEWSDTAFRDAARLAVAEYIANAGPEADAKSVLAYATREAMNAARYPTRTTSTCAKLAKEELGAAWANAIETLEYYVSEEAKAQR